MKSNNGFNFAADSDPIVNLWQNAYTRYQQSAKVTAERIISNTGGKPISFAQSVIDQVLTCPSGELAKAVEIAEQREYERWLFRQQYFLGDDLFDEYVFDPVTNAVLGAKGKALYADMQRSMENEFATECAKNGGNVSSTAISVMCVAGKKYAVRYAECVIEEEEKHYQRWKDRIKGKAYETNKVFVAMSFSEAMRSVYENAIKTAVDDADCGLEPVIVSDIRISSSITNVNRIRISAEWGGKTHKNKQERLCKITAQK